MTSETDRKMRQGTERKSKAAIVLAPLGTLLLLLWLYYGYHYLPIHIPVFESTADKLVFTLRWQLPAIGVMLFSCVNIMRLREKYHAANPLNTERYPEEMVVWRNFLSNTTEQIIINMTHHFILASYLEAEQLKLIPLLMALFVVGRFAYVIGYLNPNDPDRAYRSFGFTLSGLPQPFMFAYCMYRLITG